MAVAFDAVGPSSSGAASTSSPLTWSHTCVAGASMLVVFARSDNEPTTDTVTATYAGASMTELTRWPSGGTGKTSGFIIAFYKASPASGANTVSVSFSAGSSFGGGSLSFTGSAAAPGTPVKSDSAGVSVTTGSVTVAGTASASMIAAAAVDGSGSLAFTAGTSRFAGALNPGGAAGQIGAATLAGGGTGTVTWTQASDWYGAIGAEIPASGAVASVNAGLASGTGAAQPAGTSPHTVNAGPAYAGTAADLGGVYGAWATTSFATGGP